MFEQVPVQVWLIIAIVAVAYAPARYAYEYAKHSPARRDITQPRDDLGWRTTGQLARSLFLLALLCVLAAFIFTPTAERLARSPIFLPSLAAAGGLWALYTVPMAFMTGQIEPFIRGVNNTYERKAHPKRFWASSIWNAFFGCLCIWLALKIYEQSSSSGVQDQCYDEDTSYAPQDVIAACNKLIAAPGASRSSLGDYFNGRGIAHFRSGDHQQAVADYTEAIQLNSRDYYPFFNRALAYERLGDRGRAIADYTVAIQLRPNDADAYLNRGLIFLDTSRFDEAVGDFTRANKLEPEDPWPLANRGITYAWQKDRLRAEKDFEAVRARDPSNPVLLRGEALLAMDAGDPRTAVSRLSESLKRDPDNIWTLRMRAEVYLQLRDYEKSWADSDKVEQLTKQAEKARSTRK